MIWIATRPEIAWLWSHAGKLSNIERAGYWWKAIHKDHWPTDAAALKAIEKNWQEPWGDARQEIVS